MKKTDALFLIFLIGSIFLLGWNIAEGIRSKNQVQVKTENITVSLPTPTATEIAETEAVKNKFEALGLPLHEGKHWKVIK